MTQEELADRAKEQTPDAAHVAVENFLNSPKYDEIIASLKAEAAWFFLQMKPQLKKRQKLSRKRQKTSLTISTSIRLQK